MSLAIVISAALVVAAAQLMVGLVCIASGIERGLGKIADILNLRMK